MAEEHADTVFQLMGVPHHYNHVAGAALAAALLTGVGLYVRAKISHKLEEHVLPEPKVTLLNLSEGIVGAFKSMLDSMIGHGSEAFVPIITTCFLFILVCNLMGLVPGFEPPTENLNTNLAMALFTFLAYQYLGIKEHRWGYLKQFTGGLPPPGYGKGLTAVLALIACLMIVIETIGHAIRPVSLSLRLWGNINGDHTLIGVMMHLLPWPILYPVIFMALGVFVSVIQALVFSLLSSVYIKLAVSHEH